MSLLPPEDCAATVLALDLGTRCGYALHRPGRPLTHGVRLLPQPDLPWKGKRWDALHDFLLDTKETAGGLDWIYYEYSEFIVSMPNARGVPKAQVLSVMDRGALYGVLQRFAHRHQIPLRPVNPSKIKKAATGNGNAKKGVVLSAVNLRHGLSIKDDNEGDALALLDLALAELNAGERQRRAG